MTLKEEYKLLTLQEMKERQRYLENDLKYYLDRKETLFNRTQPGAIDYTKDSVQGGKRSNRYDDYVASVEELELNNDIDLIYKQIYSIQDWIAEKLRIIGEYEPLEQKIITLRELHKMKWDKISEATGYCDRQCKRIYSKYYKTKTGKRYES